MANVLANYVKFLRGTPTAFAALTHKDPDTMYFISVPGESVGQLWIGDKLITMSTTDDGALNYLYELADVDTSGLKQGCVLTWNESKQKWVVSSIEDAVKISNFVGATISSNGVAGLVPAPKAIENSNFLKGDGTWSPLTIADILNLQLTLDSFVSTEKFNTELDKKVNSSTLDIKLEEALQNKVDKVYYTVLVFDEDGNPVYEEDGITPKTEQVEGTLLSPTDRNKLDSLVITEEGVEISGTVTADNVQGLKDWLESNRNQVKGLLSTELENKINSIDAILELDTKVANIENSLNNYILKSDFENEIATINDDISALKEAFSWAEIS